MSEDIFDDENKDFKRQDKSRELELFSIRTIMKTENGRSFMWRCLQNCSTFENIFNIEPIQNAHNSGMRSHGIWLDGELKEAVTDDYFKMLKENYNE